MKIKDVMTRRVAQIGPDETLASASEVMREHRTGLLLIVDAHGTPAGVLTDRDIVVRGVAGKLDLASTLVCFAMSADVVFIKETALVSDAVAMMVEHRVGRLLITNAGGGVVGVIAKDEASDLAGGELLVGSLARPAGARSPAAAPMKSTALATISRRLGLPSGDGNGTIR